MLKIDMKNEGVSEKWEKILPDLKLGRETKQRGKHKGNENFAD